MKNLREHMIKYQIESRGIRDQGVIEAMKKIERHLFVPGIQASQAYDDCPLPIGHGQTISQPYIVALMTETAKLMGNEKVLEIGTGSGYQAAVLAELAKEVYSIEIVEPLAISAIARLKKMGYSNIRIKTGDGYNGWPDRSPFDVIILTAAPPDIPDNLIKQLTDGGILIAPVGVYSQELIKLTKNGNQINKDFITYVRFVPMVHYSDFV